LLNERSPVADSATKKNETLETHDQQGSAEAMMPPCWAGCLGPGLPADRIGGPPKRSRLQLINGVFVVYADLCTLTGRVRLLRPSGDGP